LPPSVQLWMGALLGDMALIQQVPIAPPSRHTGGASCVAVALQARRGTMPQLLHSCDGAGRGVLHYCAIGGHAAVVIDSPPYL